MNPRLQGDWYAIDEDETYTVLAGSFISSGKDGYTRMGEITDKIDLFKVDSETFITYVQEKGTLTDLSPDEYATQRFIAAGATEAESIETSDSSEGEAGVETIDATAAEAGDTEAETTDAPVAEAGAETSTPKSSSNFISPILSFVNLVILSTVFVDRF